MKELPTRITININDLDYQPEYDDLADAISDWLSDTYGFCHYGFDYETDYITGDITVFDIDWDISD